MGCWKVRMVYSSALHCWSSIVFPNSLINAVNIFAVWKKLRPTFPRRVDQHRHGHQGRGGLLRHSHAFFDGEKTGPASRQALWVPLVCLSKMKLSAAAILGISTQLQNVKLMISCSWMAGKKQSWNWMAGMATILVWRQRKLWISSRDYWISQIIVSFWTWTSQVKAS